MPNCHNCMEDEMHMIFECKAYTHIRGDARYSSLFDSVLHGDMKRFFNRSVQTLLAVFISDMTSFRKSTLLNIKLARWRRT